MTLFYFDLDEDGDRTVDEEGVELADLAAAREQAVRAARDIMMSDVARGRLRLDHAIVIRDEAGAVAMVVPFAEAVTVTGIHR